MIANMIPENGLGVQTDEMDDLNACRITWFRPALRGGRVERAEIDAAFDLGGAVYIVAGILAEQTRGQWRFTVPHAHGARRRRLTDREMRLLRGSFDRMVSMGDRL